jgi:hypothetical protein
LIDRAQAFADAHEAGAADLDMTGEGNSNDPKRQAATRQLLGTQKGDPADHPGATPGDAFDRELNATRTVVTGGHAECNTAPGAGKISAFGAAAAEAMGDVNAKAQTDRKNAYKSPLAMTKAQLGYDPRSHH